MQQNIPVLLGMGHIHLRCLIFTCFRCSEMFQGGCENVGCFEYFTDCMIHFTTSEHLLRGLSKQVSINVSLYV